MNQIPSPEGTLPDPQSRPWGFWATLGFSVIIFIIFSNVQGIVVIPFLLKLLSTNDILNLPDLMESIISNGLCLSLCTIFTTIVCIPIIYLFAKLRNKYPIETYLGLKLPTKKELIFWIYILVIFIVISDLITSLTNHNVVPDFMIKVYTTVYFAPLLYLALLVFGPLFEEFFFRGFMFQGIRYSKVGAYGAIGITALAWTLIHTQYGLFEKTSIFLGGILLGIAREKSDSVLIPLAMHIVMNAVATFELLICISFFK